MMVTLMMPNVVSSILSYMEAAAANAPQCVELNDVMKQCDIYGTPDLALEYYSRKLDNAIAGSGEYKLFCRASWRVMHFRSTGEWKSEP